MMYDDGTRDCAWGSSPSSAIMNAVHVQHKLEEKLECFGVKPSTLSKDMKIGLINLFSNTLRGCQLGGQVHL